MAITFTELAPATNSTTNATSYSGNGGTPSANELLIAFVIASDTTDPGSFTDAGIPWSKLYSQTIDGGLHTLYIFYRILPDFVASVDPVFSCPSDEASGCGIYVLRVTGYEKRLAPFIRNIKGASGGGTPALTFDRAVDTNSGVAAIASNVVTGGPQWSPPSGWPTEHVETSWTTPDISYEVASINLGETDISFTWTATSAQWGVIALEIALDGSIPIFQNEPPRQPKVIKYKKDQDYPVSLNILGIAAELPKIQVEAYEPKTPKKFIPSEQRSNILYFDNNTYVARPHRLPDKVKRLKAKISLDNSNSLVLSAVPEIPPVQIDLSNRPRRIVAKLSEEPGIFIGLDVEVVPGPVIIQKWPKRKLVKIIDEQQRNLALTQIGGASTPLIQVEEFLAPPKRVARVSDEFQSIIALTFEPLATTQVDTGDLLKRKGRLVESEAPNLLTSTLGIVPGDPFVQQEPVRSHTIRVRKASRLDLEIQDHIFLLTGGASPGLELVLYVAMDVELSKELIA